MNRWLALRQAQLRQVARGRGSGKKSERGTVLRECRRRLSEGGQSWRWRRRKRSTYTQQGKKHDAVIVDEILLLYTVITVGRLKPH
jgi:hypothetical protein